MDTVPRSFGPGCDILSIFGGPCERGDRRAYLLRSPLQTAIPEGGVERAG
jgi:hypothetical protein